MKPKKRKAKELERIATTSPQAQTIKYADILDNGKEIAEQDPDFAPRYLQECRAILQAADKGNPQLYRIALGMVQKQLRTLRLKMMLDLSLGFPNRMLKDQ